MFQCCRQTVVTQRRVGCNRVRSARNVVHRCCGKEEVWQWSDIRTNKLAFRFRSTARYTQRLFGHKAFTTDPSKSHHARDHFRPQQPRPEPSVRLVPSVAGNMRLLYVAMVFITGVIALAAPPPPMSNAPGKCSVCPTERDKTLWLMWE